jgi:putative NIF3 family GTP cyclohydrolase 1 type 2
MNKMEANKLYQQLERDFIAPELSDDWAGKMASVAGFLSDNFKHRSMGLVCDFTAEIGKVYTAVFPSYPVLRKILDGGAADATLFIHHPMVWDITKSPEVLAPMDGVLLQQFKDKKISIYNLHVPLDNFGKYSTSVSLAHALGIEIEKPFAPYFGALCGVFGRTDSASIGNLRNKFREAAGHDVGLYCYGGNDIRGGKVAVVAGGGNSVEILEEVAAAGVNVFVTGISAKNGFSRAAHEFAQEHQINILGGTHYSTEKFACMAMVDYFKKLDLPAEFIADDPVMEDI